MKYEQWFRTARPSPWPSCVLCVSCEVRWKKGEEDERREACTLAHWNVVAVVGGAKGYSVARTASGTTALSFWEHVRIAAARTKTLWIIGHRFREEAAALNLWSLMESGNVRIVGTDWRSNSAGQGPLPNLSRSGDGGNASTPPQMGTGELRPLPSRMDEKPGIRRRSRGNRQGRKGGVCIIEDPPIVIEFKLDGGSRKITWVDAANYGIDACGEVASPVDRASVLAEWFRNAASTLHSLGKCGWQATAGSQAMHLYRSVYHDTPILSHTEPRATALERNALFGGRCEAYQLGRIPGQSHMYDIRSMYPWIMARLPVPVRLRAVHDALSILSLERLAAEHYCIAEVAIETDEPEYPYRETDNIVYPAGRFWTHLAGAELQHALRAGNVRAVRCAASYESECALGRFAEEIYDRRCRADAVSDGLQSAWLKRLLVSLPGKFAQRSYGWEDVPGAESPWEWAEWYTATKSGEPQRWRSLAWHVQREKTGGFAHGTVPAITVAICAAGRRRLQRCIDAAGRESVYYVDTDALIVDDYGAESLTLGGWVRPGEWGFLQHIISSADTEIFGVKHYRIGGRVREAGLRVRDGGIASECAPKARQPSPRESLRNKDAPAEWREERQSASLTGKTDDPRPPGGRVKTPEKWEW